MTENNNSREDFYRDSNATNTTDNNEIRNISIDNNNKNNINNNINNNIFNKTHATESSINNNNPEVNYDDKTRSAKNNINNNNNNNNNINIININNINNNINNNNNDNNDNIKNNTSTNISSSSNDNNNSSDQDYDYNSLYQNIKYVFDVFTKEFRTGFTLEKLQEFFYNFKMENFFATSWGILFSCLVTMIFASIIFTCITYDDDEDEDDDDDDDDDDDESS
ncbi:hypothetical protein HELRODRAFT_173578 [Helobdella robusta]|uniref:Uncharacterized protein n=1 Tax=Helobdella robusta TaxID=6412 RepID=T1F6Z5_HELRO|nr:hypothetical protein HELRODRAFT_173578 [Helobdella robusta]ESO03293.1 hypothetical protein HELRODRAFT_173578 [Helobdella robusta]